MFVSVQSPRQDVSPYPVLRNSVGIKSFVSPGNGVNPIPSKSSSKNYRQATNTLDWVEMLVFVIHPMIPRLYYELGFCIHFSVSPITRFPNGYTKQLKNGLI